MGSLMETVLQRETVRKNDPLETTEVLESCREYVIMLKKTSSSVSDVQENILGKNCYDSNILERDTGEGSAADRPI